MYWIPFERAAFAAKNFEFHRRFANPKPITIAPSYWEEYAERQRTEFLADTACRTTIKLREANAMIGVANLFDIKRGPQQSCFLGYHLGEEYQGNGYMHEALEALIRFAFVQLHIHRIMATYNPANRRSHNVLERLDFVIEGYTKRYLLINGVWEDAIMVSLINENWIAPENAARAVSIP